MSDDLVKRLREISDTWAVCSYGYGNYFVSAEGHVFSKPRPKTKGGLLKPTSAVGGYLRVTLTQGNAKKLSLVHGLVADAFIGKRPNGCEVAHLNGNPSDNRATNLCYKTKTENERDKATHGTLLRGENTPSRKLSWDQVCEIRQRNASQGTLAERFSVARSTIQRIQSGQYWGAQS
jgi:hypothetical protein